MFFTNMYRDELTKFCLVSFFLTRITCRTFRLRLNPGVNYDLLIRPAVNRDNAGFRGTNRTYSELFEVIGILLRDHLTK